MRRGLVLALLLVASVAQADSFDPRVMVMPVEGEAPSSLGKLARDVADALAKGAKDTEANVARADATLADTAGIVGCDPTARECVDAVAAALNVDQLLIAKLEVYGDDALVEVTAVTRETEPLVQTFTVRKATRRADLKAIRDAVGGMLEEGEVRRAQQAGVVDPPDEPIDPTPDDGTNAPGVVDTTTAGPTELGRPSPIPKFVVIGGGVVAAIGVTFWALAAGIQSDIDDAPTATAAELDALAALEDRAALRANLGNVFVIVGAVAASAGAVWWLRDRSERRAVVAVTAGPGTAGVSIRGAW